MSRGDRLALAFASGAVTAPATGPILVLRAEATALYQILGPARFVCEQGFCPTHDLLAAQGLAAVADADDAPGDAAAAMAIVNATRQRAESLANIARALARVPAGGTVVVTGAKTDGIDGLLRLVGRHLALAGSLPKAHGKVFWLTRPSALPAIVAAWAEAYALKPNRDGFITGPGMFSPEGIDAGSLRLAAQLDARLEGRVADLGAGWGWLAARALAGCPAIARLDLYEAEARALAAARQNVADHRAAFHWSDVRRLGAGDGPCDWVIANPPFHHGRAAEPDLGAAFIAAAARILKPAGRLLMVANRQLPYEAHLAGAFRTQSKLAEDSAFKVLAAERPLSA